VTLGQAWTVMRSMGRMLLVVLALPGVYPVLAYHFGWRQAVVALLDYMDTD